MELLEKIGLRKGDLAGQVAVVTGAGRGIGKELARCLAWLGAKVVIAEIAPTGAEVEMQIRAEGGQALYLPTDMGDESSIRAMTQKAQAAFGPVDILVNNAIIYQIGSFLEIPLGAWDKTYAVNLRGAVTAIGLLLPGMLERKRGVIVTMSSAEGTPYASPYFASKAALQSLGLSIAAELDPANGVYAFVFGAGMVDTPGGQTAFEAMAPRMGMTYDQFTHLGANPGYPGLMPAFDCAAGFAHAIVHAQEHHGQIAEPFSVMARAGLEVKSGYIPEKVPVEAAAPASVDVGEVARELVKVIATVNREFEELDFFKRSWATRDFQKKTGVSIQEWLDLASRLETELPTFMNAAASKQLAHNDPMISRIAWISRLARDLSKYFARTKKDVEGYFHDPKQRALALQALTERENAATAVADLLDRLQ